MRVLYVTKRWARITGLIYLFYFLSAMVAETLSSHQFVFLGNAVNFVAYVFYIITTIRFYYLFRPVNKNISLVAAVCSLGGCIVGIIAIFTSLFSWFNLLLFFGPYCLLLGWLILRSAFLPAFLGVMMLLAGVGWIIFLTPLVKYLSLYIEIIGIAAEAALMFWLLIMGVNIVRWKEQADLNSSA
jgi:uncharacterized protein DUF4386